MKQYLQQSFSVPFQYQVLFTDDLFREDNSLLAHLLKGPRISNVLFVLDEGVAAAHPGLQQQIKVYAAGHISSFSLCADPLLIPGGTWW